MKFDNIKTLNQRLKKKKSKDDKDYFNFLKHIEKQEIPSTEIIFQFPIYLGEKNLARHLQFYELFKKVQNLSGHIADVGTWKGSSMIFMSKLVKILENNSGTKVYGFDWFKDHVQGKNDKKEHQGKYKSSYVELKKNVKMLKLNNTEIIKIDLVKNLRSFFNKNKWLRFKYVFVDCGTEKVLENAVPLFWSRLLKNGVMILDHYNNPTSPSESNIIDSVIGKNSIEKFHFSDHPSAFIIKKK